MMASRTGNVDAVKVLLDNGAAVNAKEASKGHNALIWAAAESHPAVVKLLLERGADVNARSDPEPAAGGGRGGGGGLRQNVAAAPAGPRTCPPAKLGPRPAPVFGVAGGANRTKATGGGCINALIMAARQGDKETV